MSERDSRLLTLWGGARVYWGGGWEVWEAPREDGHVSSEVNVRELRSFI